MRLLALFVFLMVIASSAIAVAPKPMQLTDETVTPDCLETTTDILCGQTPSYGTCGKGPAVKVTNKCAAALVIEGIEIALGVEEEFKPLSEATVYVPRVKDENLWEYVFITNEEHCQEVAARIEKEHQAEVARIAQEKEIHEEQKKQGQLDPLGQWHEKIGFKWDAPQKSKAVACQNLTVSSDRTFSVGIPYGRYYKISGFLTDAEGMKIAVRIKGKMTDPSK